MVCYWPARAQIIRNGRRAPGGERVRLSLLAATLPKFYYNFVCIFLVSLWLFILFYAKGAQRARISTKILGERPTNRLVFVICSTQAGKGRRVRKKTRVWWDKRANCPLILKQRTPSLLCDNSRRATSKLSSEQATPSGQN